MPISRQIRGRAVCYRRETPKRQWRRRGFLRNAEIRQRIIRFTNAYAFATYGVAGYYSPSGYEGPVIGHFGFGLNQRVSKHLAFRPGSPPHYLPRRSNRCAICGRALRESRALGQRRLALVAINDMSRSV